MWAELNQKYSSVLVKQKSTPFPQYNDGVFDQVMEH